MTTRRYARELLHFSLASRKEKKRIKLVIILYKHNFTFMWSILGSRLDLPTTAATRLQARSGYDREQAHWHRLRVSRVCVCVFLSTASHSWRRGAGKQQEQGAVILEVW